MKYIKSLQLGCDVTKIVKFEIFPKHPTKFLGIKGLGRIRVHLFFINTMDVIATDAIVIDDIEYDEFNSTLESLEKELIELFCKE